ncbi:MAG: RsmF rRNA methyltransferase first C-terminal domain-containing protein, partial [Acetivibrio ethanolgignens]
STCTFAPLENENIVGWFLKNHPDFTIKEVKKWDGMAAGESTWMEEPIEEIKGTLRLWPHKLRGEGHYVAVLERDLSGTVGKEPLVEKGISEKECKEYFEFAKQYLKIPPRGKLIRFGEQLYIAPDELPSLHRLRVLRPGLHLGTMKKNRFEPSHALALALKPSEVKNSLQLLADGEEIHAYLRGETFQAEGEKGWYLICAGDYSIGWGKLSGGIMKNHYPKGLRKN